MISTREIWSRCNWFVNDAQFHPFEFEFTGVIPNLGIEKEDRSPCACDVCPLLLLSIISSRNRLSLPFYKVPLLSPDSSRFLHSDLFYMTFQKMGTHYLWVQLLPVHCHFIFIGRILLPHSLQVLPMDFQCIMNLVPFRN